MTYKRDRKKKYRHYVLVMILSFSALLLSLVVFLLCNELIGRRDLEQPVYSSGSFVGSNWERGRWV